MDNNLTTSTKLAIGNDLLNKFKNIKFCIVGCGGIGSLFAEMHTQKSYISQTNTLGGLLLFLNANPETLVKNTKKIIDTISYLSIWKAIEIQSPEKNQCEIKIIADNLLY
jgi:hypothetical protein